MTELLFREVFFLLENYPKLYLKKWAINGNTIEIVVAAKTKISEAYHTARVFLDKPEPALQIYQTIQEIEFALLGKEASDDIRTKQQQQN